MPTTRFRPGLFLVPAALSTLSVVGVAVSAAPDDKENGRPLPLRCEIAVSEIGRSQSYVARVHAVENVAGHFHLRLTQSGSAGHAVIDQSGHFDLAAGETETLGEATLGGSPAEIEAELTLEWNGIKLACRPRVDT